MDYLAVGIDCAVQPSDVGLARARRHSGIWHLEAIEPASSRHLPAQIVAEWIHDERGPILLALNAPLGWPASMAGSLARHAAGSPINVDAHQLFRRETDRFIAKNFRKTPLDVGADRIARTAHWALEFLESLRKRLGVAIPLAWGIPLPGRLCAIEVYPAATLLAHGAPLAGYKSAAGLAERSALYALLQTRLTCADTCASMVSSPHLVDAAICALGGIDFIEGHALPPADHALAVQEGWIWARPKPP